MNLQQLRSVRETARQQYNLTGVAQALQLSQPGISRQIREFEDELGIALFRRVGKRLVGLTAPGERLLPIIERLLQSSEQLQRAGREFAQDQGGRLTIAATHSQARYALPAAVHRFSSAFPTVRLMLRQGTPRQVAHWLLDGQADIGIATEELARHAGLATLGCHRWTHRVVVPPGHALAQPGAGPLTLAALAAYPLISYEPGLSGRSAIDEAFAAAGLRPEFALLAMDAEAIKTYVRLGLGVGIVAAAAFDPGRDAPLVALEAGHLFGPSLTRLAVRRGTLLREIDFAFIEAFAPNLTRETVRAALAAGPSLRPARPGAAAPADAGRHGRRARAVPESRWPPSAGP